jgi:hypothetical protein
MISKIGFFSFLSVLSIFAYFVQSSFSGEMIPDRKAKIFELGKREGTPLFTQITHSEKMPDGSVESTVTITDAEGKLAMTEKSKVMGEKLVSQSDDQLQSQEAYDVDVKGNSATFKIYKLKDGKRGKAETEKTIDSGSDTFLTGPGIDGFLSTHWEELLKGKSVHVRFGVLERADTVGFDFEKSGKTEAGLTEIIFSPSSVFISALVKSIRLFVDPKTKHLMVLKGRSPLFKKVDSALKPLDVDLVYE